MTDFAAWYLRDDYENIRKIMDDGDQFPSTFDAWEIRAKGTVASAAGAGIVLKPVILNSEKFAAYCRDKNIPCDSKARGIFAVETGLAGDTN